MQERSSYHHPDLRQALLEGALALLKSEGIKGFSLRRLSASVGVSHAAPYRHFASKDQLLAVLLLEGHRLLAAKLVAARVANPGPALDRLIALGRAYLDFAGENPERLGLMFSGEGNRAAEGIDPGALASETEGVDSFAPLEETVRECQAEGSLDPAEDCGILSMAFWSQVHGLALLRNEGIIEGMSRLRGGSAEATVEGVLALMRKGMGRLRPLVG